MKLLKIALLQILSCGTLEENIKKGISCCKQAKEMGADIALFPEMWSNGYGIYGRPAEEWQADAVPANGAFVRAFGTLAAELDMAVGITFLEKTACGLPRNSLALFDRHGEQKFCYAKVHTCDFDAERNLGQGEDFFVCALDTACGPVNVGAMICFDREFPESARLLMLKGAEVILAPNACPMEINRLASLRSRAYENMTAIATCNYPAGHPDCNGHSTVFDGIAWIRNEPGSRDMCVPEAPEEEGIYVAEINLDLLRAYRSDEVMGNAYRRPEKYGLLTDAKIGKPFIRENFRR